MKKHILGLEKHTHAPELSRLHFKNGASLECHGCATIAQARHMLFRPLRVGKVARVKLKYKDPSKAWLNKDIQGYVKSYAEVLQVARSFKKKALPDEPYTLTIKTALMG